LVSGCRSTPCCTVSCCTIPLPVLAMAVRLVDVFTAFAGGAPEMGGSAFVKCMRDSGLLDGKHLKVVDADLIFARCKPKGCRKIGFREFQDCLALVADKSEVSDQDVLGCVCSAAGPTYETSSSFCSLAFESSGIGPERFFYDRSTYTGTHKNGGPKTYGDIVTDTSLVNRDSALDDALHRKKGNRTLPTLLGASTMMDAAGGKVASAGSSLQKPLCMPRSPECLEQRQSTAGLLEPATFDKHGVHLRVVQPQMQHVQAQPYQRALSQPQLQMQQQQQQQRQRQQQTHQLMSPHPQQHISAAQPHRWCYPASQQVMATPPHPQVLLEPASQEQLCPAGLVSTFAGSATSHSSMPMWAAPRHVIANS